MRSRLSIFAGCLFALVVFAAGEAHAGVPDADIVESRLESAREQTKDLDVELTLDVADGATGSVGSLAIVGKRASADDNPNNFGWKLLMVVLTSSDPWGDIENLAGSIDDDETDIDTADGEFVYTYGDNPGISVTRDLSVIRQVRVGRDMTRWELSTTGRLEDTPMPEKVVLLKDGQPFARVALSLSDK